MHCSNVIGRSDSRSTLGDGEGGRNAWGPQFPMQTHRCWPGFRGTATASSQFESRRNSAAGHRNQRSSEKLRTRPGSVSSESEIKQGDIGARSFHGGCGFRVTRHGSRNRSQINVPLLWSLSPEVVRKDPRGAEFEFDTSTNAPDDLLTQ